MDPSRSVLPAKAREFGELWQENVRARFGPYSLNWPERERTNGKRSLPADSAACVHARSLFFPTVLLAVRRTSAAANGSISGKTTSCAVANGRTKGINDRPHCQQRLRWCTRWIPNKFKSNKQTKKFVCEVCYLLCATSDRTSWKWLQFC